MTTDPKKSVPPTTAKSPDLESMQARLEKIAGLLEAVDNERGRQWFMDPESTIRFCEALRIAKGED